MDITQNLIVHAPPKAVFHAISTPAGLDTWWSFRSSGSPGIRNEYKLNFGPGYDWTGIVRIYEPVRAFEIELCNADSDWAQTKVGFELKQEAESTHVEFYHTGWLESNEHYKTSTYCWAMYLRLMKRYVEHDEVVAYDDRLES
jgi:uncharacterized protein YndB with AHSA1/START domain